MKFEPIQDGEVLVSDARGAFILPLYYLDTTRRVYALNKNRYIALYADGVTFVRNMRWNAMTVTAKTVGSNLIWPN